MSTLSTTRTAATKPSLRKRQNWMARQIRESESNRDIRKKRSPWFRIFLVASSIVLACLLVMLVFHESSSPQILGRYSLPFFIILLALAGVSAMSVAVQFGSIYQRIYKLRFKILALFCSCMITLAITETVIRQIDPHGISYFDEVRRYYLDTPADHELVYKHRPGIRKIYQGVEVSINEIGLRDRELDAHEENVMRILLLGDSTTFGWGVEIEDTFGRRLEKILTSKLGCPVKTINSGVAGYNTQQEYTLLKRHCEEIEPHLAILLYTSNDINGPLNLGVLDSHQGISSSDILKSYLGKFWMFRLAHFTWSYSLPNKGPDIPFDRKDPGVEQSMKALAGIASYCKQRQINFLTFCYRGKQDSPFAKHFSNDQLAEVRRIGEENGFHVDDIAPCWSDVDMRSVTNSVADPHPNAKGHELIASRMARVLIEQGLVGSNHFDEERIESD